MDEKLIWLWLSLHFGAGSTIYEKLYTHFGSAEAIFDSDDSDVEALDWMPLFARGGAVIPVSVGKPQSVEDIREVVLEVFPGNGRFVHYMDDGETMAYLDGELRALQVSVRGRRTQQKIIAAGYPGPDSLRIQWMA